MTDALSGGHVLVRALAAHGVDTVFGIPGTHNLEIYAALAAHGVRHVGTRHEQGAGYAADGYARVTGRPGVAVVTSGPATLNAAAAVGQAYSDSVPVLLVSPGVPLRHPGRGNGLLHETRDQSRAMDAVAAYSHRVTSVAEIPVAVAQAFATMTSGRPRPVHLEIPYDVLEERGRAAVAAPLARPDLRPAPSELDAAAARLRAARRPMVIAGGGARDAGDELRAVAERLGAPVVTSANGKGALPDDHPLALGAGLHLEAVRELADESDAVLVVGCELAPSDLWYGPLPVDGKVVRIDVDPVQIITNALPDVALTGDAALTLRELLARLGDAGPTGRSPDERAARWRGRKDAQAAREGEPWLWVVEALAETLGQDGVLAGDSTMACYYGALANLPAYAPRRFLYPTGYGTLGYGLPAAIGAALGRPGVPVAALLGDGGVMFTVAELATAVQLGLPLPVVVVDNGGYGEIRAEMAARHDPVHAVELPSPDFPLLARSLGADGVRADDRETLRAALAGALTSERPTVIHVREKGST
ncbi:acetolactate synthase-1/2/3 large subunit [Nonomuraea maritima]|uniref:Acetolactate synthase-1/2/3 large subunit n=1 Tax=Nonomuraea maritima TaxID=683260 RepID=A0A1G8S569_9ACTN|nr:5-guanidino-2-oxopentanoate decarboxylase [Nonomuraea maritima]SDJ24369.1 acetolactate synthase-1/2/3 large subunit [Nonomuraea maritima]